MLSVARPGARPGTGDIVSVLDLGSSKVACMIARLEAGRRPGEGVGVLGIGHQRSRGVRAGVILDLDEAEATIRAAVSQAERMAGIAIRNVHVAISCGRLRSQTFIARADVDGGLVGDDDVARVMAAARTYAERDGRSLIHLSRIGFRVDGAAGVREPRGMAAQTLAADLHAVTADEAQLRNLLLAIERAHLGVAGFIAAPYASAVAVTTSDERRLGVTVIDLGGGTATLAMFAEQHFVYADALALGSGLITFDLARALSTPLAEAERIKALYGTLVRARSDEREVVSYPAAGEDDGGVRHTSKAELAEIIRPRVAGILALLRERIDRTPLSRHAAGRVVLTGGGSQLVGLGEYAAEALGAPVRVGRPLPIGNLPQNVCSPAFAVAVGMLHVIAAGDVPVSVEPVQGSEPSGYLRRVGSWLSEF